MTSILLWNNRKTHLLLFADQLVFCIVMKVEEAEKSRTIIENLIVYLLQVLYAQFAKNSMKRWLNGCYTHIHNTQFYGPAWKMAVAQFWLEYLWPSLRFELIALNHSFEREMPAKSSITHSFFFFIVFRWAIYFLCLRERERGGWGWANERTRKWDRIKIGNTKHS